MFNPNLPLMPVSDISPNILPILLIWSCRSPIWLVAFLPPASTNLLYSADQNVSLPPRKTATMPFTAGNALVNTSLVMPF